MLLECEDRDGVEEAGPRRGPSEATGSTSMGMAGTYEHPMVSGMP